MCSKHVAHQYEAAETQYFQYIKVLILHVRGKKVKNLMNVCISLYHFVVYEHNNLVAYFQCFLFKLWLN